jgi:hypothetical protein
MKKFKTKPKVWSSKDQLAVKEAIIMTVQRDKSVWYKRPSGQYDKEGNVIFEKTLARRVLEKLGMSLEEVLDYDII